MMLFMQTGHHIKEGKKMQLSCIFGHKWRGCTCERCGETRDTGHNFDSCKGKCTICGKPCEVKHQWNGCKCKSAG